MELSISSDQTTNIAIKEGLEDNRGDALHPELGRRLNGVQVLKVLLLLLPLKIRVTVKLMMTENWPTRLENRTADLSCWYYLFDRFRNHLASNDSHIWKFCRSVYRFLYGKHGA